MKKKIITILISMAVIMNCTAVFAALGDIEGYTTYTDIAAYINHYAIQSYNVKGKTYVIAEDLENFGFKTEWNGTARTLNITRDVGNNVIDQYSIPYETDPGMVGKNALPILSTDIRTYVNDVEALSFNVDGKTVVDFESLSAFGPVNWNPEIRAIKLWVEDGLSMCPYMQQLQSLPKVTLYSADGRTISVRSSEVNAYLNVGWYKSSSDAKQAGNKAAVGKFSVGQYVIQNYIAFCKYGTVREIDRSTGKVKVHWYRVDDMSGNALKGLTGAMYGLNSDMWVDASELQSMY